MTTCYKCTGSGFTQHQRAIFSTQGTQTSLVGEACSFCHGSGKLNEREFNEASAKRGFSDQMALLLTLVASTVICFKICEIAFYADCSLIAKAAIISASFLAGFLTIGSLTTLPSFKRILKWTLAFAVLAGVLLLLPASS